MTSVPIEQAQAQLPELINQLRPGETLIITRDEKAVARLSVPEKPPRKPREPGNCVGMLTIVADDEEHLEDFAEYME